MGVPSRLIERAADIDWDWLGEPRTLGITAGASAPEVLVREAAGRACASASTSPRRKPTTRPSA